MRHLDVIQLIVWAVIGFVSTWGMFLAWIGFKNVPNYSKRRLAKSAATITFVSTIIWIIFWVSAVVFNFFQILGGITWHLF